MDETSKFIAGDLHVHTPASKCYKGPKTKEEYFEIVKRYYEKNIYLIAITDHNTIAGYKEYLAFINNIKQKKAFLDEYVNAYPDLKEELDNKNSILKIVNKMLVLPGVEFEARPGIHLLFIFNPEIELRKIEEFLEESGYITSEQGTEDSSVVNCDVIEALEKVKVLQAITIAAHVDSTKGIYSSLEANIHRARIFRSDNLDAISVNSVTTIEKIKGILTQPDYKRSKPLAIIQSSDSHMACDCGKMLSYFNMEKMDYNSLNKCIMDPNTMISTTEKPEIISIIKKIANDSNTITYDCIDQDLFNKVYIAMLNNKFGNILLGVTADQYKTLRGIDLDEKEINVYYEKLCKLNDKIKLYSKYVVKVYKFGLKSIIDIKVINISSIKFYLDNKYYILEEGKIDENNIINALEKNEKILMKKVDQFHERMDENIADIHKQLSLLLSTKQNYRIVQNLEKDAIRIAYIGPIELVEKNTDKNIEKIPRHGTTNSNVYYAEVSSQRDEDVYLRFTCPMTKEIKIEEIEKMHFKNEAMIIVPRGATHYIANKEWVIINSRDGNPFLVIQVDRQFENIVDLKVLVAWTKSSLFLYYLYCKTGDIDLYLPDTLNSVFIPMQIFKEEVKNEIIRISNIIIEKEEKFLEYENKISKERNPENFDKLIKESASEHNKEIDRQAKCIDKVFYEVFGINENEKKAIEQFIKNTGMHNVSET